MTTNGHASGSGSGNGHAHAPDDPARRAADSLLGALLRYPAALAEVLALVAEDDLPTDAGRKVFASALTLFRRGVPADLVTVADELHRRGWLADAGGYPGLAALAEAGGSGAQAAHYARLVRDRALLRRLALAAGEILREATDPPAPAREVLDSAERRVFALAELGVEGDAVPLAQALTEAKAAIDARRSAGGGCPGVPTGFVDLDRLTAGLQPGELIVLAARPSVGKTALGCALARNAARAGVPCLVCSLEQSRRELAERLLCAEGPLDSHRLRRGYLSGDEVRRLQQADDRLRAAPVYVDDTRLQSALRVTANARRHKARHGVGLVVLDYLQLVEPEDRKAPRHEQVGLVTRRLRQAAGELALPVVALAQLNREVEHRGGQRPKLSDLRDSGEIEQHADVVVLLHRPEPQPPGTFGTLDLIVAKQRNGPTGDVVLSWDRAAMRFADYAPDFAPHGGNGRDH